MFKLFHDINTELVELCLAEVEKNDAAHRSVHIHEVAMNSIAIAARHGIGNFIPFKLAALIHDMFTHVNRKRHHELSAQWARDNLPKYGYELYAELVAGMCLNHRASGDGLYSNLHEQIFAAGDRGPVSLRRAVERCIVDVDTSDVHELFKHYVRAKTHLTEKFSDSGYSCVNPVHEEMYGHQLLDMRKELAVFTFDEFYRFYTDRDSFKITVRGLEDQYVMFTGKGS